ncbi:MAG: (2Fe-2S)-binding protein [Gammaproteobacteria bacterium]
MFVCVCHAITDREIDQAVEDGAVTLDQLKDELDVGTSCGTCAEYIEQRLQERLSHSMGRAVTPALA